MNILDYSKEGQEPRVRLFYLGSELQEAKTLKGRIVL